MALSVLALLPRSFAHISRPLAPEIGFPPSFCVNPSTRSQISRDSNTSALCCDSKGGHTYPSKSVHFTFLFASFWACSLVQSMTSLITRMLSPVLRRSVPWGPQSCWQLAGYFQPTGLVRTWQRSWLKTDRGLVDQRKWSQATVIATVNSHIQNECSLFAP